jgi:PH/SEC7 domain-containing protein
VRATDYSKKQFVFRLYTADQAQYLFQTSDEKELMTWINAINYVVASFASPQLPAACASSSKFQRPLLPSSRTRLNPADQLEAHEKRLMELRDEIEDHLQHSPQHGTLGGGKNAVVVVCAYKEKTEFLKFEIMRYETYIITLRTRNGPD